MNKARNIFVLFQSFKISKKKKQKKKQDFKFALEFLVVVSFGAVIINVNGNLLVSKSMLSLTNCK